MNYLEWNNAIINHFFTPENDEKEVVLYFSHTIIREIGRKNFPESENEYIEDFYLALRTGVSGLPNEDYINRILELEKKYKEGVESIDDIDYLFPPYITYMLSFILPFTSGEAVEHLNVNNFHDNAKRFFEERQLVKDYSRQVKYRLNEIDHLWKEINTWLIDENNFRLGFLEEIDPPGNRKYVQKFEYHILFRKEQEERLSKVFDAENILPGDFLSEKKIRELLIKYADFLKLSQNTVDKLKSQNDYIGKKIVKRALRFYKNWDGTNYQFEGEGRGYSRNRLVLCLDFNLLRRNLIFKHFRINSKKEFPEILNLTTTDGLLIEGVFQHTDEYSTPIIGVFKSLIEDIDLKTETYRGKYSWRSKDLLLFKRIQSPIDEWVEIQKVEFNCGTTLLLSKKDYYTENLEEWVKRFEPQKIKLFDSDQINGLPENWVLLKFENVSEIPHDYIVELKPSSLENKPAINFDKTFYQSGFLFNEKLPLVWAENTDNPGKIIAEYSDGKIIPLEEITFYEESENGGRIEISLNKFQFTQEHVSKKGEVFKLKCGSISYHRFLKIIDFKKEKNTVIERLLPIRNGAGQLSSKPENFYKGLEIFIDCQMVREYLPWQSILEDQGVFKNSKIGKLNTLNGTYKKDHLGNTLLHYISTKGRISKIEFDNAVFSCANQLIESKTIEFENFKKKANYLRYELQDLGYIDYDSSKSQIVVNKPQLLIKPTDSGTTLFYTGARDESTFDDFRIFFKTNKELEGEIEILTEENVFLPQAVFVNFKSNNHKIVQEFANISSAVFKKYNLNTQFILTKHFGSMIEWRKIIKPVLCQITDFEGGELFDINRLEFIEKPTGFDKSLAFVKFSNINGFKTIFRLWYQGNPYVITDQQYGIFLFLYLYRTKREDNYKVAVRVKGWKNCSDEYDEKEKAPELTNVILYDRSNKTLAVPINCRLPRQISIAVSLLSGESKVLKYLKIDGVRYTGTYLVYKNVPSLFANNNVALILGQSLIHTTLKF